MTSWKMKRFWSEATVAEAGGGWEIRLDGRPVRTPGKSALVVPTRALAAHLASEWEAQTDAVDPETMPATRMANSAIEKVAPQIAAVASHLLSYGGTDLLCYRAEAPEALVARQSEAWDPWIAWAAEELGARLTVTAGIVPVDQPPEALAALGSELDRFGAFELAAVHDLVGLPGSLVLGLAAARGAETADAIWRASRIDEIWQIEQWGEDDLAEAANARKARAFAEAVHFLTLVREI